MAKETEASEKPVETTTESSFRSFLAREVNFSGRKAAKIATKSREVPRHIKIGQRTFLKVYYSLREASTITPGSGMLLICQGSVELLENVSSKSGLGSTCLVRCEMKTARGK